MSVLSVAVCSPDIRLQAQLQGLCLEPMRETIPPTLRRRSSQAMLLAFTAATAACRQANCSPSALPAIFASVAGEIQTTDQLCVELVRADGMISPNAFHNSVQNTVAGYWSIAQQCTQPAIALAAGFDTLAMALLEAWCQLSCHGGELLLVCYDESCPNYLMHGQTPPPFACAMVLTADTVSGSVLQIGKPFYDATIENSSLSVLTPTSLLTRLSDNTPKQRHILAAGSRWYVNLIA
jgi:hypothetical protein